MNGCDFPRQGPDRGLPRGAKVAKNPRRPRDGPGGNAPRVEIRDSLAETHPGVPPVRIAGIGCRSKRPRCRRRADPGARDRQKRTDQTQPVAKRHQRHCRKSVDAAAPAHTQQKGFRLIVFGVTDQ